MRIYQRIYITDIGVTTAMAINTPANVTNPKANNMNMV